MLAHIVKIRVFCSPEDCSEDVLKGFHRLLPQVKGIVVRQKNAVGFNNRLYVVVSAELRTQRTVNAFLSHLAGLLTPDQKQEILRDPRLDENMYLFLRMDKDALIQNEAINLVEHGSCFHISIGLAPFPKREEAAKEILGRIFG